MIWVRQHFYFLDNFTGSYNWVSYSFLTLSLRYSERSYADFLLNIINTECRTLLFSRRVSNLATGIFHHGCVKAAAKKFLELI